MATTTTTAAAPTKVKNKIMADARVDSIKLIIVVGYIVSNGFKFG